MGGRRTPDAKGVFLFAVLLALWDVLMVDP